MLQNIHIQNFRCFEDFKADGFERINLIGGKNNSGKTCLLEALACLSKAGFVNQADLLISRKSTFEELNNIENKKGNDIGIKSSSKDYDYFLNIEINSFKQIESARPRSSELLKIYYFLPNMEFPTLDIVDSFDVIDYKGFKKELIEILKCIDNRIADIRTFKTKEGIHILIDGASEYIRLNSFGDATKNLIRYCTPFFLKKVYHPHDSKLEILLIDEIENGIHYTAHHDFWKNIFKLSKELNVQVFSTTHSLEMIKAFNEVAKNEGEGAYFEMAKEYETGQIFAQKHDAGLLEYELEKTTSTFRGE